MPLTKVKYQELAKGFAAAHLKEAMASGVAQLDSTKTVNLDGVASLSQRGLATAAKPAASPLFTVPVFDRYPHLVAETAVSKERDLVMVYIDLTDFSRVTQQAPAAKISELLSEFYDIAVNAVESKGGVVEKFIGDAVIAVFGHPFRNEEHLAEETNFKDVHCALFACREIVEFYADNYNDLAAKASMVRGNVVLGWMGPESYQDLTIIGEPMTTLFRLEGDTPENSVMMLEEDYQSIRESLRITTYGPGDSGWSWESSREVHLRGPGKTMVRSVTFDPRRRA